MPKFDETKEEKSQEHIHNWYPGDEYQSFFYCKNGYKGGPCITLKCGEKEYARRCEEWDAYLNHCRTSDSYQDYLEIKKYCPPTCDADREAIKEILTRVHSRMRDTGKDDKYGEPIYQFDEDKYIPTPDFSDPYHPFGYIVEGE